MPSVSARRAIQRRLPRAMVAPEKDAERVGKDLAGSCRPFLDEEQAAAFHDPTAVRIHGEKSFDGDIRTYGKSEDVGGARKSRSASRDRNGHAISRVRVAHELSHASPLHDLDMKCSEPGRMPGCSTLPEQWAKRNATAQVICALNLPILAKSSAFRFRRIRNAFATIRKRRLFRLARHRGPRRPEQLP